MADSFGTPSYPSPLDRIRTGKRERAAQLGLSVSMEEQYESNQSFPGLKKNIANQSMDIELAMAETKCPFDRFKGKFLSVYAFVSNASSNSFHRYGSGEMLFD